MERDKGIVDSYSNSPRNVFRGLGGSGEIGSWHRGRRRLRCCWREEEVAVGERMVVVVGVDVWHGGGRGGRYALLSWGGDGLGGVDAVVLVRRVSVVVMVMLLRVVMGDLLLWRGGRRELSSRRRLGLQVELGTG